MQRQNTQIQELIEEDVDAVFSLPGGLEEDRTGTGCSGGG